MNWIKIIFIFVLVLVYSLIINFIVNTIECKQYESERRKTMYFWVCNLCWIFGVSYDIILHLLK